MASSRSLAVSAEQSIWSSGTLIPFRLLSLPPTSTSTLTRSGLTRETTLTSMKPSSSSSRIPGVTPRISAVCSTVGESVMRPGRVASALLAARPNSRTSPRVSGTGTSSCVSEQRNLGPWMSPRIRTSRPAAVAAARIHGISSSNWPGRRWEALSRKTSTPAATSFWIMMRLDDAGPSVATTLPLRFRKGNSTSARSVSRVFRSRVDECLAAKAVAPPFIVTAAKRGAWTAWTAWPAGSTSADAREESTSIFLRRDPGTTN